MSGMRWAVIPTRGDRQYSLGLCLDAIAPQVDRIIVIDNSPDGFQPMGASDMLWRDTPVDILRDPQQPPNLSNLWNQGIVWASLRTAVDHGSTPWIAVLNDDVITPPTWFGTITQSMLRYSCVAGGFGGRFKIHTVPGVTALDQRLPGHAFILDGRYGLRADEQFRWWCGDNDLDMQARAAGGTLILANDPVQHLYPDQSTRENPELAARTAEDMRLFVEKWGFRPWVI